MIQKKILILHRRDVANPHSGGGVQVLHKIAKRLCTKGHKITWVSGGFHNGEKRELVDGVEIIRLASEPFVYFSSLKYFLKVRHEFDLVIEAIVPIPYFLISHSNPKRIAVVYHLAKNTFFTELVGHNVLAFLPAIIGRLLERLIPIFYRHVHFLTFSSSTKNELSHWGILGDRISVAQEGINLSILKPVGSKKSHPYNILHLGRIVKYKGIHYAIQAMKMIKDKVPNVRLSLVGDGPYRQKLQETVKRLDLESDVHFHGYVSDGEKVRLLSEARILVMLSSKEGWATPVIEANACGTVAVGFSNVGIRETIKNGETGFLVRNGDVEDLVNKCLRLLTDEELYEKMRQKSLTWAKKFDWERTEKEAIELIENILSDPS